MSLSDIVSIGLTTLIIVGSTVKWAIGRIDKKFTKIDEKFDNLDEKFAKLDEKFNRIDEKFDKIISILNLQAIQLSRIEGRFEERDLQLNRNTGTQGKK